MTTVSAPGAIKIEAEAEAVAAAVLSCPGVAGMHPGRWFDVVTLLPGRRVEGVRLSDERVRVGVVAAYGIPLILLAGQVRRAVAPLAGLRPIDVHVADLQGPEERPLALPAAGEPGTAGAAGTVGAAGTGRA